MLANMILSESAGSTAPAAARAPGPRRQAASDRAGARPAILRQRFRVGRLDFDYRTFPRQRAISIMSTETMVHVVVPVAGETVVVGEGESVTLAVGAALLVASGSRITCVWAAGSSAMLLHLPRASIQAEASRALGAPRRLAIIDHVFDWSADMAGNIGALQPHQDLVGRRIDRIAIDEMRTEKRTLASLVAALRADSHVETLFPLARSVQRAVDHIRTDPHRGWSVHELAPVAGVTVGTLRRNFRTCLGVTVTQLVQQIRLEWVRSRLESAKESRSISELSLAAGFGASGMLNRAYQRRFGETPSQTRTRAFRLSHE